jgi:FSR family fosmidomycin resistance protein-like MFS transporter
MQKAVADHADPPLATPPLASPAPASTGTLYPVLIALSFSHMMNDMMQSLIPALYPVFKQSFGLDFGQVGLITLTFQMTASLLQPAVGVFTDRRPLPCSPATCMASTLIGLPLLSQSHSFNMLLFSAGLVGVGSSIFHPESSRVARLASGGKFGLAQSLFQVGGNCGQAIGPLLAAIVVMPHGQGAIAWFSACALVAMFVLFQVGLWYRRNHTAPRGKRAAVAVAAHGLSRARVTFTIAVLVALIFSKNVYTASLSSYYTFYLINRFGLSTEAAQLLLFVFMASVAVGTLVGGPFGDRIGRKAVIWVSILGVLPFTLALPYVGLTMTAVLTVVIGMLMASAFPAILVYAQDLLPGRVGMVSGIFFGLSFGLGGVGAAAMGNLADHTSIEFVYKLSAFLPLIGLVTALLPNIDRPRVKLRR